MRTNYKYVVIAFLAGGICLAEILSSKVYAQGTARIDKKYTREISALSKNNSVQDAFQSIEEFSAQALENLILLTELPAPPFKEEKRAAKYAEMLKEYGADSVWIDGEGNAIGLRKGTKQDKTVVLEAHIDTVFPEETDVRVKQRGDTLFAPGIMDDTRGLAMLLTVLQAMEKHKIETEADVLFIGTVGEEGLGDLRGVKYLFREGAPKIDAYIAVDGSGLGRITHEGLGSHRYKVTFKGPGGHSWGAFGLVNPHHALGKAIAYFTEEADRYTQEGPRTSYNVGMIGGGTSVNAIPFESWMQVDMRSESPEKLEGIDEIFQRAIQKALEEENAVKRRGPDLEVDIEMIGDRPSGKLPADLPLVQRTIAATQFFDQEPMLRIGSTNSNTPISKGVPAVTIGAGGEGGKAHSLEEWYIPKDDYLAAQRTLLLLLAESGLAK
ncbi:M20/M25/M40 family metallo-hydrolase [Catalinimonas alkaloidigena]|uniref:M20/M25/M40 family metallo-hydrolase n=1 Tax=Catalinimonas alkaloidigena TaxID=1075417 RepID=UPI0024068AA9|nr:M20/M25/M40 family metallo-hydrolase [Catalinimonas alkaloidigena]